MGGSRRNRPVWSKRAIHRSTNDGQSTGASTGSVSLMNHQLNWTSPIVPGWRGTHADFAKRPEMGSLVGLPVVLVGQTLLKVPGCGNEIIGKGNPRSLARESLCEVPHIIVSLAAGNAGPSGNDGLFDGHGAVEVGDETLADGARDKREGRSLETADLFDP